MSKSTKPHENDAYSVQRGDYNRKFFPIALFVAGRLATGPIQYALIKSHPLSRFGFAPPPTGGFIDVLGHRVPRMPFLTVLMPTVLSIKHATWLTCWCRENITFQFACFGVLADLVYESVSTLVFTGARANPFFFSDRQFYIGTAVFFTGLAIETVAELQRAMFKARPENRGKLCTTGLWSVTRHINYTANVIFGFGVGLAVGGPGYSIATAGMYLSNFIFNAIPSIETYCAGKYGKQWDEYERKTPSRLIPFIY